MTLVLDSECVTRSFTIPMLKIVTELLNQSSGQPVFECRHCGTTVETLDEPCPACGSAGIAKYDLSTE